MIVDMKGKAIDPPSVTRFVSFDDFRELLVAHNDLVDAHNTLHHKSILMEKRLEKLEKPKRKWWRI